MKLLRALPLSAFLLLPVISSNAESPRCGSRRCIHADHDVYAFVRAHLDDRILVVLNRSKTEAKMDLHVSPELIDGEYTEALSRTAVQVRDRKMSLSMRAQTAAFVSRSP